MKRLSKLFGGEDVDVFTPALAAKIVGFGSVMWILPAVYNIYDVSNMLAHVASMSIAVAIVMSDGMLSVRGSGDKKTARHKMAMRLAGVLLGAGAYFIVQHKWASAGVQTLEVLYPQSIHSWVGTIALACAFIQTWTGILGMGGKSFHVVFGKVTFYTCSAASVLGADNMLRRGPHYWAVFALISSAYYVAKARGELPAPLVKYFAGDSPVAPTKKVKAN